MSKLLLVLGLVVLPMQDANGAGQEASIPPKAPMRANETSYFGTIISDPYHWMQESSEVERLRNWAQAQNSYARSVLAGAPHARELLTQVSHLSQETVDVKQYTSRGRRYFFLKRPADSDHFSLFVRDVTADSAPRLLLDPASTSHDGKPQAIDFYAVSRDGKYVCAGISAAGSEESVLRVVDVASGALLPDTLEHAWNAHPQWRPDGHSFFYRRSNPQIPGAPEAEVNQKIRTYMHVLGTDPARDVAVFGFGVDPRIELPPDDQAFLFVMPSTHYALAAVFRGTDDHFAFWVAPIATVGRPNTPWRKLGDFTDQVVNLEGRGDFLYMVSHRDAARGKLLRLRFDAGSMAEATTLIAHSEAIIESVGPASDALYVQTSRGGLGRLLRLEYSDHPRAQMIALPMQGVLQSLDTDVDVQGATFTMESWVQPPRIFSYVAGRIADTKLRPSPEIDVTPYSTEEVIVPSSGGVQVPLSIVFARNLEHNGRNPTWLSAYGAYGMRYTPSFQPRRLAWLASGGIYAVCHVRGGGELGEDWHRDGMKQKKKNGIDDAIACARYLIDHKYTSPAHLAIEGGSAGGVLAGGVLTLAPELFGAAILRVPMLDLLALKDMIVGPANQLEFGSAEKSAEFPFVLAASPYHNVRDGARYPAVLLTAAENDRRIPLWQAAKMAARLQAASTSGKPILLRVQSDAGHGMTSTKTQLDAELADCYAFLLWQLTP